MPNTEVQECKLASEKRWTEIRLEIQEIKGEMKAIKDEQHRQSKIIADVQQLSTSVSILANNMKSMLEELQKQNKRIEKLEQKPGKRWESAISKVIDMLIGAGITYLLVKIGLA